MNDFKFYSFGELFSSAWETLKQHYSLCLGISFLLLFVYLVVAFLHGVLITFITTTDHLFVGTVISNIINMVISGVFIIPLCAYCGFWLVKSKRNGESAKKGAYGTIVTIAILTQLCMLPGQFLNDLGNANSTAQLQMIPKSISTAIQLEVAKSKLDEAQKKDNADSTDEQASLKPLIDRVADLEATAITLDEKMKDLDKHQKPLLRVFGGILLFAAFIFIYFWSPWAMYAALDPTENVVDKKQAIARGRELAQRGGMINIWLAPLSAFIIAFVSTIACFLPGLFLGIPLAVALVPSMYMILKGE